MLPVARFRTCILHVLVTLLQMAYLLVYNPRSYLRLIDDLSLYTKVGLTPIQLRTYTGLTYLRSIVYLPPYRGRAYLCSTGQ